MSLYKRSLQYDGTQKQFCDTRRPKLSYVAFKKGVSRLYEKGIIKKKVKVPKTGKVTKKAAKKGKSRARRQQQLTHRQQKLIEQQLSSLGKTNAQMAKNAGYNSTNMSKSFINATKGNAYQETLARSKAKLREMVGIPGIALLIRLIEIGLSRLRDFVKLENGVLSLRDDVTFDDGADLSISAISVKESVIKTKHGPNKRSELKIVTANTQSALIAAIKIGGYFDDSIFSSLVGGDDDIVALWGQFKDQEITANDFATELAMRGLTVPKAVELQAKAELAKLYKAGGGDDDPDNIDLMNSYDEMLENAAIAKKKLEVETQRKKELELRERELEELNKLEDDSDIVNHADQDED